MSRQCNRKRGKRRTVEKNKLFESLLTDSSSEKSATEKPNYVLKFATVRVKHSKNKEKNVGLREATVLADISAQENRDIQTSEDYELHISVVKNVTSLPREEMPNDGHAVLKSPSVQPSAHVLSSTPISLDPVSAPCSNAGQDLSLIKVIPEVIDPDVLSMAEENLRRFKREVGCDDDSVLGGSPMLPQNCNPLGDELENLLLKIDLDGSVSSPAR